MSAKWCLLQHTSQMHLHFKLFCINWIYAKDNIPSLQLKCCLILTFYCENVNVKIKSNFKIKWQKWKQALWQKENEKEKREEKEHKDHA